MGRWHRSTWPCGWGVGGVEEVGGLVEGLAGFGEERGEYVPAVEDAVEDLEGAGAAGGLDLGVNAAGVVEQKLVGSDLQEQWR